MWFTLVFRLTIDFECVGKHNHCEEELKFLEEWPAPPCFDKVCIEVAKMNVEDSLDDENVNEIFMYLSCDEIKFYCHIML